MGLINFILAGHSYGGYICGLYACKYESHVKKLLMLSAVGVGHRPEGLTNEKFLMRFPAKNRPPSCFFRLGECIWNRHWSPFGCLRGCCSCF